MARSRKGKKSALRVASQKGWGCDLYAMGAVLDSLYENGDLSSPPLPARKRDKTGTSDSLRQQAKALTAQKTSSIPDTKSIYVDRIKHPDDLVQLAKIHPEVVANFSKATNFMSYKTQIKQALDNNVFPIVFFDCGKNSQPILRGGENQHTVIIINYFYTPEGRLHFKLKDQIEYIVDAEELFASSTQLSDEDEKKAVSFKKIHTKKGEGAWVPSNRLKDYGDNVEVIKEIQPIPRRSSHLSGGILILDSIKKITRYIDKLTLQINDLEKNIDHSLLAKAQYQALNDLRNLLIKAKEDRDISLYRVIEHWKRKKSSYEKNGIYIQNDNLVRIPISDTIDISSRPQKTSDSKIIPNKTLEHSKLIRCLKILGYPINEKGMCYGITFMAMQAALSNDFYSFNSRIQTIANIREGQFLYEVETAEANRRKWIEQIKTSLQKEFQEKYKLGTVGTDFFENGLFKQKAEYYQQLNECIRIKEESLTQRERDLLSMRAFFDGVSIYYHPQKFPELFEEKDRPTTQNNGISFLRTLPKSLTRIEDFIDDREKKSLVEKPTVQKVGKLNGSYRIKDLTEDFTIWQEKIKEKDLNVPFSLILSSGIHSMSIHWVPENKSWIFLEVNQLPAKEICLNNPSELAQNILQSMSENKMANFDTQIYAKEEHAAAVRECLDAYRSDPRHKSIHTVTSEKAQQKDSKGLTWAYIAAREGDIETLELLLETKTVDVNEIFFNGTSAICAAIHFKHSDCVNILLQYGANPNRHTNPANNNSLLHEASWTNNPVNLKTLLDFGASPDKINKKGESPIFIAAKNGYLDIVKLLLPVVKTSLSQSISIEIKTLKEFADKNEKKSQFEEFLRSNRITGETLSGFTPLHAAVFFGHAEIAEALIAEGANPFASAGNGITPLELAELMGHQNLIQLLNPPDRIKKAKLFLLADINNEINQLKLHPSRLNTKKIEFLQNLRKDFRETLDVNDPESIMLFQIKYKAQIKLDPYHCINLFDNRCQRFFSAVKQLGRGETLTSSRRLVEKIDGFIQTFGPKPPERDHAEFKSHPT